MRLPSNQLAPPLVIVTMVTLLTPSLGDWRSPAATDLKLPVSTEDHTESTLMFSTYV